MSQPAAHLHVLTLSRTPAFKIAAANPLIEALSWCAHETAREIAIIQRFAGSARCDRDELARILDLPWSIKTADEIAEAILAAKREVSPLLLGD